MLASSRSPHPARLIPLASSRSPHPARLIPLCPSRSALHHPAPPTRPRSTHPTLLHPPHPTPPTPPCSTHAPCSTHPTLLHPPHPALPRPTPTLCGPRSLEGVAVEEVLRLHLGRLHAALPVKELQRREVGVRPQHHLRHLRVRVPGLGGSRACLARRDKLTSQHVVG